MCLGLMTAQKMPYRAGNNGSAVLMASSDIMLEPGLLIYMDTKLSKDPDSKAGKETRCQGWSDWLCLDGECAACHWWYQSAEGQSSLFGLLEKQIRGLSCYMWHCKMCHTRMQRTNAALSATCHLRKNILKT